MSDVDGLLCATAQSRTSGLNLAEYLGISPAFIDTTILGGSSFMFHVAHAQAALQLRLCQVAVIAYGSTQRTIGRRQASVREYNPYETPFRPFLPSTAYALAASRHMHEFGTTREQLAAVAVEAREWGLLNPAAWEKKPLTIPEVLSARMISYPFTVRDICLVTDGGGAVIMTSAERARSLKQPPVYVLGCGQAITHASISSMPDLTVTGALQSGRAAYAMAGLGRDIDVVELYDAFTSTRSPFLDLGFPPKGEGAAVRGARRAQGSSESAPMAAVLLPPPRHVRPLLLIEATRSCAANAGAESPIARPRSPTAMAVCCLRRAPSSLQPPRRMHEEAGRSQRRDRTGLRPPRSLVQFFSWRWEDEGALVRFERRRDRVSPSTPRRSTRFPGCPGIVEISSAAMPTPRSGDGDRRRVAIAGASVRQLAPPPAPGTESAPTRLDASAKPVVAAIHVPWAAAGDRPCRHTGRVRAPRSACPRCVHPPGAAGPSGYRG